MGDRRKDVLSRMCKKHNRDSVTTGCRKCLEVFCEKCVPNLPACTASGTGLKPFSGETRMHCFMPYDYAHVHAHCSTKCTLTVEWRQGLLNYNVCETYMELINLP